MLAAIAAVTGLAWWDDRREADDALHDLAAEQSLLASSLAADLHAHLTTVLRDAILIGEHGPGDLTDRYSPIVVRASSSPKTTSRDPAHLVLSVPIADARIVDLGVTAGDLLDSAQQIHGDQVVLLVAAPEDAALRATDGRLVQSDVIREGIDRNLGTLRLDRTQAAQVGLPARTSMAGIAAVTVGDLGRWSVVAVASAARERDREKRATWRLVLGVLVASGLVLAFGGAALRRQRKGLELQQELALAEVQNERNAELARAERVATMGTFAMGIAHEVATPLGVIVGRAEQLLGRQSEDDRVARSAQTILQQADRIQHIVRRFLDLARGGAPSLERADPARIVRGAVAAVEHRFEEARVRLKVDVQPAMPAVQCDRNLLEQALVNLLLNACEACGPGGSVEICARSDAEQIAFVVTDDGEGISAEAAARATEPFFTTKSPGTGTGLGLAIATEIVKSHHGRISLAPNPGKGTRARIEIPIASARAPDA